MEIVELIILASLVPLALCATLRLLVELIGEIEQRRRLRAIDKAFDELELYVKPQAE